MSQRDIRITPYLGSTQSIEYPEIEFGGLSSSTIKLKVDDDGSVVYTGTYGVLFNISDEKDGLLHSVNDVSGLPIFQVYSYDYVQMGKWDKNTLVVNSDKVGIGLTAPSTKLEVVGQTRVYKNGTYSYYNVGYNSAFEGQILTNTTNGSSVNLGVYGIAKPTGLTANTNSFYIGVGGLAIYDGDTAFVNTGGSSNNSRMIGVQAVAGYQTSGGGTAQGVVGVQSTLVNTTAGFTQSVAINYRASWLNTVSNNGWTDDWYAFFVADETITSPNISRRWGIYVNDSQAHNVFLGTVSVGNTNTDYKLNVSGEIYTTSGYSIGATAGWTGTFSADGQVVNVIGGIITSVV